MKRNTWNKCKMAKKQEEIAKKKKRKNRGVCREKQEKQELNALHVTHTHTHTRVSKKLMTQLN